jgi:hypothetical protein
LDTFYFLRRAAPQGKGCLLATLGKGEASSATNVLLDQLKGCDQILKRGELSAGLLETAMYFGGLVTVVFRGIKVSLRHSRELSC